METEALAKQAIDPSSDLAMTADIPTWIVTDTFQSHNLNPTSTKHRQSVQLLEF
jgi:hypothetical protein